MFLRYVVATLSFVLTLLFSFTAPKLFPIAYSLVKPFLNEVTRNKIKIFGGMSVAPCSFLFPCCNLVRFSWSTHILYICAAFFVVVSSSTVKKVKGYSEHQKPRL